MKTRLATNIYGYPLRLVLLLEQATVRSFAEGRVQVSIEAS